MTQVKLTNIRDGLDQSKKDSTFCDHNAIHGVAVSPDSGVSISNLENSCYISNYRWKAAWYLGADIRFDGTTYNSTQLEMKDILAPAIKEEPRKCKKLLRCRWNCKCGK